MHVLSDEIPTELEEFIDLVAKRITALRGYRFGIARVAATQSILPEFPFDILSEKDYFDLVIEEMMISSSKERG